MLSVLEDVVLLAVDEKTGHLRPADAAGTAYALAGGLLFDLALAGRIDSDTEAIVVLDGSPTGDAFLDGLFTRMSRRRELSTVRQWIEEIFLGADDLQGKALDLLIHRGILRHEKSKRLWVIDVERFPVTDEKPHQEVKARLARTILTDEIPETRDIMLISLADACGLLHYVVSEQDAVRRRKRIRTLTQLETISRKVTAAIGGLRAANQDLGRIV